MNIIEFIDAYNSMKTDDERKKLIMDHIKSDYIPYEKKADIAKAIANSTYWIKENNNGNDQNVLHVDSVAKYMLARMAIVDLFTDIERQHGYGKMLEDFNTLNANGVLDYIVQNVDQKQMKEFNLILQMTCEDIITNEFENHSFISKQVIRFVDLFKTSITPILSQIDTEKIKDVIDRIQ